MRVTVLAENKAGRPDMAAEHGLSLLIESSERAILCDAGQSDATWQNAAALGTALSKIDAAVLSHGHYDHGGGLLTFAKTYSRIPVYMRREATGDFFHDERSIGIDKALCALPQVQMVADTGVTTLFDGASVFGGFGDAYARPRANVGLETMKNGVRTADDFSHEQALVVTEGEKRVLVSGCAHSGILNILARFAALYGGVPDAVLSGFHTAKPEPYTPAEIDDLQALAAALAKSGATFYTGHCTGDTAFAVMKPLLGDRLVRMQCGDVFEI